MSHHRQLQPLRDRLTPEQYEARAAKIEMRRQNSLEHAKTRGMATVALNNTARLYTLFRRIVVVGMVGVGGLLALYSAILIMWWLQAELRLH